MQSFVFATFAIVIYSKHNMKRILLLTWLMILSIFSVHAQEVADSTIFTGKIVNKEYQVWIEMDFKHQNILTPGQEIFGLVPGYFGARRDTRKWIITDTSVKGKVATVTIINDYGSEDLEAQLTYQDDGTYLLERLSGSTMKIVVNRSWVKIPKKLVFTRE